MQNRGNLKQESESLSQNVKLGLKYRNEQDKVQINHNRFLESSKGIGGNRPHWCPDLPDAKKELPYEGGKEMLLVEDVDNREFLEKLFTAIYEELPAVKKKRK